MNHDLVAAFGEYLLSREDRPNDGLLHVGDVANGCSRAVWHQVKHGLTKQFDAVTQCKFRQGEQIEDLIGTALDLHYGALGYVRDVYGQSRSVEVLPGLQGHPDYVYRHPEKPTILGEAKSTLVFYDRVRKGVFMPTIDELRRSSTQYVLQGTGYAHAPEINAPQWFLFLVDRGTGQFEQYWFETATEWPAFEARAVAMLDDMASNEEPDPTLPTWTVKADGTSYLCRGCPVLSCDRWGKANKAR